MSSKLSSNTNSLRSILETVNNLPDAGSGQVTPEISIDSSGLITATAGTKNTTKQLTTQAARTITPSVSEQTAVTSGVYTTGAVTVAAVPTQTKSVAPTTTTQNVTPDNGKFLSEVTVNGDANLIPANIVSGKSIFGVAGSAEVGSGDGGSSETANIIVSIDVPLAVGDEKLYYISPSGLSSIQLMDYELDSFSITCVIPSIVVISHINAEASGGISVLFTCRGFNGGSAYSVTGPGTLYYMG